MSLVLIGVTAFVTDFGMAYVHKRELQTAADAAALSAAQVFEKQLKADCSASNMAPVEALRGAAESSADSYLAANVTGDVGGEILPGSQGLHCKGTGVEVVYQAQGSTPTFFGPGPDQITTSRSAAAAYDRVPYGKLRPWGLCSSVVNSTGEVTFVGLKGAELKDASAGCGGDTAEPPGGWYVMECTDSGGSTGDTATNVSAGCTTDIVPVPDQTLHNASPSQLWSYLTTYCPKKAKNTTCLASDSGYNVKNFATQWQALVGHTIEMPVLCYPPQCQSLAVAGSGSTASFAVHKIAVVEICGFGLHGVYSTAASWPTDDCTAKNPKAYKATDVASGGAGFFLIFRGVYGADSGDARPMANGHLRLTQ
jgi:hypothetical protein